MTGILVVLLILVSASVSYLIGRNNGHQKGYEASDSDWRFTLREKGLLDLCKTDYGERIAWNDKKIKEHRSREAITPVCGGRFL